MPRHTRSAAVVGQTPAQAGRHETGLRLDLAAPSWEACSRGGSRSRPLEVVQRHERERRARSLNSLHFMRSAPRARGTVGKLCRVHSASVHGYPAHYVHLGLLSGEQPGELGHRELHARFHGSEGFSGLMAISLWLSPSNKPARCLARSRGVPAAAATRTCSRRRSALRWAEARRRGQQLGGGFDHPRRCPDARRRSWRDCARGDDQAAAFPVGRRRALPAARHRGISLNHVLGRRLVAQIRMAIAIARRA